MATPNAAFWTDLAATLLRAHEMGSSAENMGAFKDAAQLALSNAARCLCEERSGPVAGRRTVGSSAAR